MPTTQSSSPEQPESLIISLDIVNATRHEYGNNPSFTNDVLRDLTHTNPTLALALVALAGEHENTSSFLAGATFMLKLVTNSEESAALAASIKHT